MSRYNAENSLSGRKRYTHDRWNSSVFRCDLKAISDDDERVLCDSTPMGLKQQELLPSDTRNG